MEKICTLLKPYFRLAKKAVGFFLLLTSIFMVMNGFTMIISTSGLVTGSSFGMQISMLRELAYIVLWLGLFTIYNALRCCGSKCDDKSQVAVEKTQSDKPAVKVTKGKK